MDKDEIKLLLDRLEFQYRIYRGEVRAYLQIAAGSVSILILVLLGEVTASKDHPELLFLVPISILSYIALLTILWIFANIAATYSELLELEMNDLLRLPAFQFENHYVGPKRGRSETLPFIVLYGLTGVMPVALCIYALSQVEPLHEKLFYASVVGLPAGLAITLWALLRLMGIRRKLLKRLLRHWQKQLGETTANPSD
jgi:hypothetical protein